MISIFSYLSNYREEVPVWLKDYLHGKHISFKDIMSSRVGYYPGYYQKDNCDGTLIKVCNKSHSVHSFLYVDYINREALEKQIAKKDSFRGYHSIGQIEWQESDIMPSGQHCILKPNKHNAPYCFSMILERNEEKDDTWGEEHFVVTFLFGNRADTYYWIFKKEYSMAPWIFYVNERYIRYTFEHTLRSRHGHPKFVIFDKKAKIWEGYEKVENVSPVFGEFRRRRDLYIYSSCILTKTL